MSDEKKLTPAERIAAVNEKRERLKKTEADAKSEQQATDLEALCELEEEHGFERVLRVDIGGWKPGEGAATLAVVRIPKSSESIFKRFESTVSKSKEGTSANLDALHLLADACLLYPSAKTQPDLHKATFELAPGLRSNLGLQISKTVQGKAEEEKKD